jgi:hypothetical protein
MEGNYANAGISSSRHHWNCFNLKFADGSSSGKKPHTNPTIHPATTTTTHITQHHNNTTSARGAITVPKHANHAGPARPHAGPAGPRALRRTSARAVFHLPPALEGVTRPGRNHRRALPAYAKGRNPNIRVTRGQIDHASGTAKWGHDTKVSFAHAKGEHLWNMR